MSGKRVLLSVGIVALVITVTGVVYSVVDGSSHMYNEPQQQYDNQVLSAIEQSKKQDTSTDKHVIGKQDKPSLSKQSSESKLVWQQDFSQDFNKRLNPKYWNIATPKLPIYNEEAQIYSSSTDNVRVANGKLILEAHRTSTGYSSGRIDTKGKVKIEIGSRLEARIKLPKGKGVWPAFWLLSTNQPYTSKLRPTDTDWQQERFYMRDGEIDIMESYGSFPGFVEATAHTFGKSQEGQRRVANAHDNFHTYWLEWYKDKLVFGVDDTTYNTYQRFGDSNTWPFTKDNQMYIILNLALGGTGGGQIVQRQDDMWRMEVESVKYFRL